MRYKYIFLALILMLSVGFVFLKTDDILKTYKQETYNDKVYIESLNQEVCRGSGIIEALTESSNLIGNVD